MNTQKRDELVAERRLRRERYQRTIQLEAGKVPRLQEMLRSAQARVAEHLADAEALLPLCRLADERAGLDRQHALDLAAQAEDEAVSLGHHIEERHRLISEAQDGIDRLDAERTDSAEAISAAEAVKAKFAEQRQAEQQAAAGRLQAGVTMIRRDVEQRFGT